jgi:hypothetical protein
VRARERPTIKEFGTHFSTEVWARRAKIGQDQGQVWGVPPHDMLADGVHARSVLALRETARRGQGSGGLTVLFHAEDDEGGQFSA